MKRQLLTLAALATGIGLQAAQAKISIRISHTGQFQEAGCTGSQNPPKNCPSRAEAAYSRIQGYTSMRDGLIPGSTGTATHIAETNFPFTGVVTPDPDSSTYVAYGRADELTLPENGNYEFRVRADVTAFLWFDGTPMAHPWNLRDVDAEYTGAKIGTTTDDDKSYFAISAPNLTSGVHKLEFMYYSAGEGPPRFVLYWKVPGATDFAIIPPEAFGSEPSSVFAPSMRKAGSGNFALNLLTLPSGSGLSNLMAIEASTGRTTNLSVQQAGEVDLRNTALGNGVFFIRVDREGATPALVKAIVRR